MPMRISIYYIFFTLLVNNTVIGQIKYPNTFDYGYKSKYNLNYDSIKKISEFVLYSNDTALLSNLFLNFNIEGEFKPKVDVLFSNGLISTGIHYNSNKADTIHYLYKESNLVSSYHVSASGTRSDSIYFHYYPNLIEQQSGDDSIEYSRIFEYDSSGVLIKEKIFKNKTSVAIIDYYFSDTLEITSFKFEQDTICFKQIIIREHENNVFFNEHKMNYFNCKGEGQVIIQRFIYNEFNNVTEIDTYFNGELNAIEKYYYFLNYGLIFAFEETSTGPNKITKYVIN